MSHPHKENMKYNRRTFTAAILLILPQLAWVRTSCAQGGALFETIDGFKGTLNEQKPLLRPDGLMRLMFLSYGNGSLIYKETFSRPNDDAHICYISKVVPLSRLDPETVNVTQNDRFGHRCPREGRRRAPGRASQTGDSIGPKKLTIRRRRARWRLDATHVAMSSIETRHRTTAVPRTTGTCGKATTSPCRAAGPPASARTERACKRASAAQLG